MLLWHGNDGLSHQRCEFGDVLDGMFDVDLIVHNRAMILLSRFVGQIERNIYCRTFQNPKTEHLKRTFTDENSSTRAYAVKQGSKL